MYKVLHGGHKRGYCKTYNAIPVIKELTIYLSLQTRMHNTLRQDNV